MGVSHDEQMRAIELEKARLELEGIKGRIAFKRKSIQSLKWGIAALVTIWLVLAAYDNFVSPAIADYKRDKEFAEERERMKDPKYACNKNDSLLMACVNRALDNLPRSMDWGHAGLGETICQPEYGLHSQCVNEGLVAPLDGSSYGRKRD